MRVEGLDGVPLWTVNDFWERARRREREPTYDIRVQPLATVEEPVRSDRLAAIRAALGDAVRLVEPRDALTPPEAPMAAEPPEAAP